MKTLQTNHRLAYEKGLMEKMGHQTGCQLHNQYFLKGKENFLQIFCKTV